MEELPHLPAGGRASFQALCYLAGAVAVVALAVGYGWVNLKTRNPASEPLVVWKSQEPRLLLEAISTGLVSDSGMPQAEKRSSPEGVPCSQLGDSWFRAMPDLPGNAGRHASSPDPVACDWTPGAQEVIVITR